ncbi:hypothetical protein GCM10017559_43160 [Streptosporangium longisporum]|uniref:Uncharacterized protein n=1 Tax=Streptosporangium longisporum TaxID=46187 RepID=A0ABN3Y280_9ACTN
MSPIPKHRRHGRGVGLLAQIRDDLQAGKDPNKVQAAKFFIDHISRQSTEWAKAGIDPRRATPPAGPGDRRPCRRSGWPPT